MFSSSPGYFDIDKTYLDDYIYDIQYIINIYCSVGLSGEVARDQISDPLKNQISDIRLPPPPQIKYQISRGRKQKSEIWLNKIYVRYQTQNK